MSVLERFNCIRFERTSALHKISAWVDFGYVLVLGNAIQGTDQISFLSDQNNAFETTFAFSLICLITNLQRPITFERQIACLIDYKYQFANNKTYPSCVSRMSSQTTSSTPRKAPKRGRKPNSSGPSDFCRIRASSFAIHFKIPKVLNSVALVNYNERDKTV